MYLVIGSFGAALIAVFSDLPHELIASLAGVALLSALTGALTTSLADTTHREAAVITFLATASGLTLFGIGSAFWGLTFGFLADLVLRPARSKPATASTEPDPAHTTQPP